MKRHEFFAQSVVGIIVAIGQAVLLAYLLINSKPYKILHSPPAEFYSWVGYVAGFVSPILAVAILLYLKSRIEGYLLPIIPVIATPIIFWGIYKLSFALSGHTFVSLADATDLVASEEVEYAIAHQVISVLAGGLLIGLCSAVANSLLFKRKENAA